MHPLRGFSVCFVQRFFITCFLPFSPLSSMDFCTMSSGFLHFQTFSMYVSKNFTRLLHFPMVFAPFSSGFCYIFLHFHCIFSSIFTASSWFVPSVRSGFLLFPRDFAWFVPSIRSGFLFPRDFVRFPLIAIIFSCIFIGFSNTSSWSFRPPKRRI